MDTQSPSAAAPGQGRAAAVAAQPGRPYLRGTVTAGGRMLLLIVPVVHFAAWTTGLSLLDWVAAFLALAAMVVTLPWTSRQLRVVGGLLVLGGVVALSLLHVPADVWLAALVGKLSFYGLVVFAQALRIPLRLGAYETEIRKAIRAWSRPWNLSFLISLLTFVLSLASQFGAVPVVAGLMRPSLRGVVAEPDRFLERAIARGFTLAMLCAPASLVIPLVAALTGLPWLQLIGFGALMSLPGLILILVFSLLDRPAAWQSQVDPIDLRRLAETLVLVVVLVGGVVALDQGLGWPVPYAVMAGAAVAAGVMTVYVAGWQGLRQGGREFFERDVPAFSGQLLLFLGIGFLTAVFEQPAVVQPLSAGVNRLVADWGAPLVLAIIPLVIIAGGFIGLHPIVSISALATLLARTPAADAGVLYGFAFTFGSAAVTLIGPFMNYAVLISGLLEANPFRIAFRWNWDYAVVKTAVFCSLIYWLAS